MTFSPTKSVRWSQRLLMALVLCYFLWHIAAMFQLPQLQAVQSYLPLVWSALAGVLACRGQTWRRKSVWLLALGLGLIFLRCLAGGDELLAGGYTSIVTGIAVFGLCYQLPFALRKELVLRFLRILLGVWTAWMALLALAGLWAALYDQTFSTPAGGVYLLGIQWGRLNLLTYCTNSASNLAFSILGGFTGLMLTRNRLGRALYALACLTMFLALSLTVARTAFLSLGFSLGLFLACPLFSLLGRRTRMPRWLCIALCGLMSIAVTVGCYLILNGALELFNTAKVELRASAEALETIAPVAAEDITILEHRPIQLDDSMLTGRQYVWQGAYRLLRAQPLYLLWGTSVVQPMQYVNPLTGVELVYEHMHNLYLQVLVECGLPGLILLGLFLWRFLRSAWRLMLDSARPLWMRTLPILPICALVAETVECFTLLTYSYPVLPFMMLFMGLTILFADDATDFFRRKERP